MDPYYNQQPTPFHNWIIGVIVAIAIILLLIFFRVVRYRRRYVRVQVQRPVYPPTPGRVESGFNRDCKKAIQQSHACRCNDVYDPVTTDGPPPYTPGARPPTYPPGTYALISIRTHNMFFPAEIHHHHHHTDIHHTTHVNVDHHPSP